ncbi:hypothetical protein LEMLEM_LOCUS10927 [Lemmus lemmus]
MTAVSQGHNGVLTLLGGMSPLEISRSWSHAPGPTPSVLRPGIRGGGWFSGYGRTSSRGLLHSAKSPGPKQAAIAMCPGPACFIGGAKLHLGCGTLAPLAGEGSREGGNATKTEDLRKGWREWDTGPHCCQPRADRWDPLTSLRTFVLTPPEA